MMDAIDRQAAIDALADMHCKSDEDGYVWIIRSDAWARIDALPSAQPEITLESAIDYLHSIGWMQEHDKVLTESAQPEIIRCKDCKYYQFADHRSFGMTVKLCKWFGFEDVDDHDFCSRAERREE